MEAQSVTMAMIDRSAGYEATPERVRLGELARFAEEVQTFLKGDTREVDAQDLEVSVQKGSLAIQTVPIHGAPKLFRDLQALGAGELLDSLDAKRREIIEKWQKAAKRTTDLAYRVAAPFLDAPVIISATTDYHSDDADQWVQVERYIRGVIENLGGVRQPNAHVRLPDGRTLVVATERELLSREPDNKVYKKAMLRIRAEYNVQTRELRNAKLLEFVDYTNDVDEAHLRRLGQRGSEAWKDVDDPTAWVDDLRGGKA